MPDKADELLATVEETLLVLHIGIEAPRRRVHFRGPHLMLFKPCLCPETTT
jgi:hypothetical protein